jgi:uncharacterized membrane protein YkvA (DUF1232 family)
MSLGFVLRKGLDSVIGSDDRAIHEIIEHIGATPDHVEHIRATLMTLPDLMFAVDRALRNGSAPAHAKRMWLMVISYLVLDRDLIPASEDNPVLGLLDDAYLLHRAAEELAPHLESVDVRSISGGAEMLAGLLPITVVRQLDAKLANAKTAASDIA